MPTVFDNIENQFLENAIGNGLKDALKLAYRGDFCVGYFNLRGWRCIEGVVDSWHVPNEPNKPPPCRLLVGMHQLPQDQLRFWLEPTSAVQPDQKRIAQLKKNAANEFRKQLTIGFPTDEDESALRKLVKHLKSGKLRVKLFLRHTLHAKLYLAHRNDSFNPTIAYLGSSNLTFAGLKSQGELNIDVLEKDAAQKLNQWFLDRWEDARCIDITDELIEIIESSWAGEQLLSPYHVYLKIAWHLSQDARDGIKEFRVPSAIRGELLPFQEKAVQLACRKLNKQGGVMIGDVVGLGKTRIAAAVARVLSDDQMLETLILCPKNLTSMWEDYARRFGLRAPKVMSQSVAQRELPELPRYRLVIIDESHNFRNREGKIYQSIRDYIALNDSKVLLLSATPYNKTYLDLSAQLRLFLNEQHDLGIRPETLLREQTEYEFVRANPNTPLTSLAAFEQSRYPDDWRDVMRLFLVRRTRSFIVNNYAEVDERNHRPFLTLGSGERIYFPKRIPVSVQFRSDPDDPNDCGAKLLNESVLSTINGLNLPRYGRSLYLKVPLPASLSADEIRVLEDLSRAGKRMKGFCRTNLFKRLESSTYSFVLSVHRHILRNYIEIHALEHKLALPIGQQDSAQLDTRLRDTGDGELDLLNDYEMLPEPGSWDETHYRKVAADIYAGISTVGAKRYRWVRAEVFKKTLLQHLRSDAQDLLEVLRNLGPSTPANDYKFQSLCSLVRSESSQEKFLLFTQFADTARYLASALQSEGFDRVDAVTGDSENPALQAWKFSPVSNEKTSHFPPHIQTRILIATDVLSEGQNLQDASRVINYDLPWAIIRLVQRAGRVDRIGQKRDEIHCYSFLPSEGVESIINLRRRLINRLRENEEVVGSDEAFFEDQTSSDEQTLRALYNEASGVLDEPEDDEVDLTSEAFEVWAQAIKRDPSVRKKIEELPDVVYATKQHLMEPQFSELSPPGVLAFIRTPQEHDALLWIDPDGKTVSESLIRIFRQARCDPEATPLPRRSDHHRLVAQALKIVEEERSNLAAGQLGSRRGARYRTYERLQDFLRRREGDLFLTDLVRAAIQAVYDHPLTSEAVDKLNRQLRLGITDDDLAALVTQLHSDDRLVMAHVNEGSVREPRILCSLGLVAP